LHQSRSSHGPSLRWKGSFAQAIDPRLGETANRGFCWFRDFSLKRALLAWARPPLAQRWGSSPELQLQRHTSSSHRFSLRRAPLAWARHHLAQNNSSSPEWELEYEPGLFLLVSPGRDSLAWARVSILIIVLPASAIHTHSNNSIRHFIHSQ